MTYRPITARDILNARDTEYPLTPEMEANLLDLVDASNAFGEALYAATGIQLNVSSGYRPGHYNTAVGGAPHSTHMTCEAVDWADPTGAVDAWVQDHLTEMREFGFVGIEHPDDTPGWCHTDLRQRLNWQGAPYQIFRT